MEEIINFGLEATQWLQGTFPQFEGFFQFMSTLGREEFYLAMMPLIYWCINKTTGKHLAYIFLLSNALNNVFKHGLRGPRPYWIDSSLSLSSEPTYGVPSNHTQSATVMYLFLASSIKRSWAWLLAILIVLAMGISRIYLGVHFVHDVIAGLLLGLLILLGMFIWKSRWEQRFQKRILGFRLMIMTAIPVAITAVYIVVVALIGTPNEAVSWSEIIPEAEQESLEVMVTAVAALFGIGVGLIFESSRVRFLVKGEFWKRFFRYLLGMIVAVAIWGGLKTIFPEDPVWLGLPLRFVRYALLTLWVSYYGPWLFVKIGLAEQAPEPEFTVSL